MSKNVSLSFTKLNASMYFRISGSLEIYDPPFGLSLDQIKGDHRSLLDLDLNFFRLRRAIFALQTPIKGPASSKIFAPAANNFALQIPIKWFPNDNIFAPAAGIERRRRFFLYLYSIKYEFHVQGPPQAENFVVS